MNESARIHIGNQTAYHAKSILEPFEFAIANGFDAFEWFPDKKEWGAGWDERDINREARALIKDTALDCEIRLSVHAKWQANPLKPGSFEYFDAAAGLACDIGASVLNIHLYADKGVDAFSDAIIPLIRKLSDKNIMLSIENTPDTGPEDFNGLFERIRGMGYASNAGMCLDIGHANLCNSTRNDYLLFIDRLGPEVPIVHVHMHENYGDADSHLPLFTGPSYKNSAGITGVIQRLKKRGFSGSIILEQWPQPPELLKEARNRLLSIIG